MDIEFPLISWTVFLPLVGVAVLLVLPKRLEHWARTVAWGATAATFVCSLALLQRFVPQQMGFQFVERRPWIPAWGVEYHVGVDGLSLLLVVLSSLLTLLAVWGSWNSVSMRPRAFMITVLLLEVGMNGVFVALDVFLFYVFWEVMLFPMYFLIGVWGAERRLYAAIKFVLYTMSTSVLMLVALIVVSLMHYWQTGMLSFALEDWLRLELPLRAQLWLFAAFALAFAVKVPLFPLHTWLPDAHVEAPTAGSVILAGVLLKMGVYGFLRFALPLFPQAAQVAAPLMITLSVIGILYGALVCMVQPDMKKLVAYSSVSHMGFVMLGVFSFDFTGMQGGILQMLNHGIITGALFLIVGMLYERRHTKDIAEYGGLARVMPRFSTLAVITVLASIGLPGLNGFVGEYLILVGAFRVSWPAAVLAALAMILAAVYLLWMVQRVFFGAVRHTANDKLADVSWREFSVLAVLVALMIGIGVYPQPILERLKNSVQPLVMQLQPKVVDAQTGKRNNGEIDPLAASHRSAQRTTSSAGWKQASENTFREKER